MDPLDKIKLRAKNTTEFGIDVGRNSSLEKKSHGHEALVMTTTYLYGLINPINPYKYWKSQLPLKST